MTLIKNTKASFVVVSTLVMLAGCEQGMQPNVNAGAETTTSQNSVASPFANIGNSLMNTLNNASNQIGSGINNTVTGSIQNASTSAQMKLDTSLNKGMEKIGGQQATPNYSTSNSAYGNNTYGNVATSAPVVMPTASTTPIANSSPVVAPNVSARALTPTSLQNMTPAQVEEQMVMQQTQGLTTQIQRIDQQIAQIDAIPADAFGKNGRQHNRQHLIEQKNQLQGALQEINNPSSAKRQQLRAALNAM